MKAEDRAMMTGMLRPAAPADRSDLIALVLAEDAAWSNGPEVSAEEAGEVIDHHPPGMIFERDGRVTGYASVGESGGTILFAEPGDAVPALEALVAWLGERGQHEVDSYAGDAQRIAWLETNGFRHQRSSFDLERGVDPPLAPAAWPRGITVVPYTHGEDDAAVHELIYVDAAWGDVAGHSVRSLEAWRSMLAPYRGWVAHRDGRPVRLGRRSCVRRWARLGRADRRRSFPVAVSASAGRFSCTRSVISSMRARRRSTWGWKRRTKQKHRVCPDRNQLWE